MTERSGPDVRQVIVELGCSHECEWETTSVGSISKPGYAQAPTKLMQNAPPKTRRQAKTLFFPRSTRQLSSLRKSSDISSTSEAKIRRPAEMAFMVPTTSNPTSELGLYRVCVARPIACPIGVLHRSLISLGYIALGWQ